MYEVIYTYGPYPGQIFFATGNTLAEAKQGACGYTILAAGKSDDHAFRLEAMMMMRSRLEDEWTEKLIYKDEVVTANHYKDSRAVWHRSIIIILIGVIALMAV